MDRVEIAKEREKELIGDVKLNLMMMRQQKKNKIKQR